MQRAKAAALPTPTLAPATAPPLRAPPPPRLQSDVALAHGRLSLWPLFAEPEKHMEPERNNADGKDGEAGGGTPVAAEKQAEQTLALKLGRNLRPTNGVRPALVFVLRVKLAPPAS